MLYQSQVIIYLAKPSLAVGPTLQRRVVCRTGRTLKRFGSNVFG